MRISILLDTAFAVSLFIAGWQDKRRRTLSHSICISLLILAIANLIYDRSLSLLLGLLPAIGISLLFYPKGIGGGDIKVIACMGLYLGLPCVLLALITACFGGVLQYAGYRLLYRRKPEKTIPFCAWLAVGSALILALQYVHFPCQ